ncbi:MAG: T9SS type A sorting domain-containing protein [Prolixibacteraceae bacterium]
MYFAQTVLIWSLKLFDLNGRQLKVQNNFNETKINFDMDVVPGIYMIQFQDNTKSYFKKVVVN